MPKNSLPNSLLPNLTQHQNFYGSLPGQAYNFAALLFISDFFKELLGQSEMFSVTFQMEIALLQHVNRLLFF